MINFGIFCYAWLALEETAEPVDVSKLPEIPEHVPYLIVGAGTAAFTAYKAIRAGDAKAKVIKSKLVCLLSSKVVFNSIDFLLQLIKFLPSYFK